MKADVVVVGAGPAGSALARRLALFGFDVVLLDRPNTRNFTESLTPGVRVHLDTLGIDPPPGRICTRRIVRWRGETEQRDADSLIVDRAVFDAHLRAAAADAGVRVLHASIDPIDAPFLADATGRAGLLRRPRRYATPRTFAIRARWYRLDAPDEMRVCVLPHGWMWGTVAAGGYEVALFVGRGDLRTAIAESELFPFLDRPPDVSHACDATPFVSLQPVTEDSILVGDAACAIDPLSSSGIQAALGSAIAASTVVHTMLATPEHRDAAMHLYEDHVSQRFARHDQWTADYYAAADADGAFWHARTGGKRAASSTLC